MFPSGVPSKPAAYMGHFKQMQVNAEVRAIQERRRSLQEAQRIQMDYERVLGEQAQSTIAPLRIFRHQMSSRQRRRDH